MKELALALAKAFKSGVDYLTLLLKTSRLRRMKAAIEAGEKYIQVNQKSGEFEKISDEEQVKLLRHYAKRFFHYN